MPQAPPSWVLAPYAGLALDHDFQNGFYWQATSILDPALLAACIRASTGYEDDNSSLWTSFGNNVLRRTNKGLLIEEARTNSLRNNSMQGAAAGSPGTLPTNWSITTPTGLTRTITLGSTNGVEYIEVNYTGTTSSSASISCLTETTTGAASVTGEIWAQSGWFSNSSTTGISSFTFQHQQIDSGGVALANTNVGSSVLGASWARVGGTATNNNASTGFIRQRWTTNVINNSVAVNVTFRIGWPQMEKVLGASDSYLSPIRTTSAAVTRAADANTIKALINASAIVLSGVSAPGIGTASQVIWQWDDGTENNRVRVYRDTSRHMQCVVTNAGVAQAALDLGTVNDSTAFKIGFAWAANDFAATLNGGTMVTDNSGSVPTGLVTQRIGADSAGSQGNIYLRRQTLWARRVPNSQLQTATT